VVVQVRVPLAGRTGDQQIDVGRNVEGWIDDLGSVGEPPTILPAPNLVVHERRHAGADLPADVVAARVHIQGAGIGVDDPLEPGAPVEGPRRQRDAEREPARAAEEIDNTVEPWSGSIEIESLPKRAIQCSSRIFVELHDLACVALDHSVFGAKCSNIENGFTA
jgi:hypothetical protein